MVIFPGLDGNKIYIMPAWVQMVRATTPSEARRGAKTKVILSGESIFLPDDPGIVAMEIARG